MGGVPQSQSLGNWWGRGRTGLARGQRIRSGEQKASLQRLNPVHRGGPGLPLCAALGTKGQCPARQPWQGLGQILRTRQGGGQPGTGCGHAEAEVPRSRLEEAYPGCGGAQSWQLDRTWALSVSTCSGAANGSRAPGRRPWLQSTPESEEITEWREVGKAGTKGLCPLGKDQDRGGHWRRTYPQEEQLEAGGVSSQQGLSFCETQEGPVQGEVAREFWWKMGASRASHTLALQAPGLTDTLAQPGPPSGLDSGSPKTLLACPSWPTEAAGDGRAAASTPRVPHSWNRAFGGRGRGVLDRVLTVSRLTTCSWCLVQQDPARGTLVPEMLLGTPQPVAHGREEGHTSRLHRAACLGGWRRGTEL